MGWSFFPVKWQTHLGPIPRTQELRDKKGKRALDLAGQMPGMLVMPVMCLQEKEGLRIAPYRAINHQKKGKVFTTTVVVW